MPRPSLQAHAFLVVCALLCASTASTGCKDDPSPDARSTQVPAKSSAATTASSPSTSLAAPSASLPASALAPVAASAAAAAAGSVASSLAASASAAPLADAPVDCDALLEPADIAAICGKLVAAAADQPTDDIGKERTCSRRFASPAAGTLSMLVVRHESEAVAKERFKEIEGELSELKALTNIGDLARKYVKKAASGDPIWNAEAIRGRFSLVVFNSKVSLGPTTVGPVCNEEELEKLLARVIKRLP